MFSILLIYCKIATLNSEKRFYCCSHYNQYAIVSGGMAIRAREERIEEFVPIRKGSFLYANIAKNHRSQQQERKPQKDAETGDVKSQTDSKDDSKSS